MQSGPGSWNDTGTVYGRALDGRSPMPDVEFRNWSCCMSLNHPSTMLHLRNAEVACLIDVISHVSSLLF